MNIKWIGSPNCSPSSKKLKTVAIVDHIMSGTLAGTDSWFLNPVSKVSAHYGVGKDGEIHQYVSLDNPAWANGGVSNPDWALLKSGVNPNYYTVSIEHEGESGDVMPEAQYQATLELHRFLINELGLEINNDTIIGHYRIDSVNKANCPGSGFPWTHLFADLRGENDVMDTCVLLLTKEDFWAGFDVSVANGNCPIVIRYPDRSVPSEAMKSKKLIVVGGSKTGHANEVWLSGNTKYDTADVVRKYLGV